MRLVCNKSIAIFCAFFMNFFPVTLNAQVTSSSISKSAAATPPFDEKAYMSLQLATVEIEESSTQKVAEFAAATHARDYVRACSIAKSMAADARLLEENTQKMFNLHQAAGRDTHMNQESIDMAKTSVLQSARLIKDVCR